MRALGWGEAAERVQPLGDRRFAHADGEELARARQTGVDTQAREQRRVGRQRGRMWHDGAAEPCCGARGTGVKVSNSTTDSTEAAGSATRSPAIVTISNNSFIDPSLPQPTSAP